MIDDRVTIAHTLPGNVARIYAIGDAHIGSQNCDIKAVKAKIDLVRNDPEGYLVIAGDMCDMGLKNSKTNIYEEVLQPKEQLGLLQKLLEPVAGKILAAVDGNHEYRVAREVGISPTYDVFARLGIPEVFRQNMAGVNIKIGRNVHLRRPHSYRLVVMHGSSAAKMGKLGLALEGVDVLISGHTHQPSYAPKSRLRFDATNNRLVDLPFMQIVVGSAQGWGGYAIRGAYLPTPSNTIDVVEISGKKKKAEYACKMV